MTFSATAPPLPTDRYAVLGHPVAHSRSPTIHAAFARACGEQLHYGRLLCPLDGFEAALRAWVASASEPVEGGSGELMVQGTVRGCNVTVPFKFDAYRLAAQHSARAALAEAANVLSFEPGGWRADNTDGAGLVRDIQHNAGTALAGQRVLVIGAGGAAAGALGPLLEARPALLVLANRTEARAMQLVHRHTTLASSCQVELRATGLDDTGSGYDVVVNASASSLHTASVPVPGAALRPGALALDMMYGPAAGPFLAWAAEHGANGRDGLGMLVEQAAESFAVWRGVRPATAGVLAALRAGADQVLR